MAIICSMVIIGFWMEHFLLLGPVFSHSSNSFPLGYKELTISVGFLGIFVLSILLYLKQFPDLLANNTGEVD